jgi:tRNA-dihydrouridine synthase
MQTFWQEKIRVGNLTFPRFIGAPLDGITDAAFRKLIREFSKDELLYTEMRHVACVANDKGAAKALHFDQSERPLSYQVAANYEKFIEEACDKIVQKGVDIIDLNVGCPARNVISSGSGSALMGDLPRLQKILTCFRKKLNIPFSIKIRAGFKECNALEVAKLAQDCGVDALAIHPRLQTMAFQGRPDYALAAQVKKALSIPVFFSGGVVILSCAIKHFNYMLEQYGPHAVYMFRKHVPFYIRGLTDASQLRQTLVSCQTPEDVLNGLTLALQ